MFLFAMVYTSIYRLLPGSFQGTNLGNHNQILKQFVNFLYFSIVTISTVGFGDITPVRLIARLTVTIEIVFEFIIVVYAISSFTSFRKSFKKHSPFAITNENSQNINLTCCASFVYR